VKQSTESIMADPCMDVPPEALSLMMIESRAAIDQATRLKTYERMIDECEDGID